MKKLLIILILFGCISARGQYLKMTAYGYEEKRHKADSVEHIVILQDTLSLHTTDTSSQFGLYNGALYWHYGYWRPIGTGTGSGGITAVYAGTCLTKVNDSTLAFDAACALTLQTNGVNNGSQTILNLQQGDGVVLADNGSGQVTISTTSLEIDTTFTLDGTILILTIPHGLASTPNFISVEVDNEQGLSTFVQPYADNTNIYIPYSIGPICTCTYQIKIRP